MAQKIHVKKSQAGIAIITTVLLVGVMLSIVFTLSAVFIPKIRSASETKNSVTAIYAAESGLEWCLFKNNYPSTSPMPLQPIMDNGSTYTVTDCTSSPVHAVGTYRGVTLAFELSF